MMLAVRLKAPASHDDKSVESDYFESMGSVFQTADSEKVAVHTSGMWHGAAGIYLSLDFPSPTVVHFHNPELGQSEKFGPFPAVRIINGSMWNIMDPPQLIAHFDDARQAWHIFARPAVIMPRFTIRPAD
jgi:hypothetical protein